MTGWVSQGMDAQAVDAKLIRKYGIDVSESTRARRKQAGQANLQYLRHGRLFVILATKGDRRFFENEAKMIRDFSRVPLKFAGYSISVRRGGRTREGKQDNRMHSYVPIERKRFQQETAYLLQFVRPVDSDSTMDLHLLHCPSVRPECFKATKVWPQRSPPWRIHFASNGMVFSSMIQNIWTMS